MSTTLNPVPGSLLSDIILWVRRIIKNPSPQSITDQTIADYINRFYTYDMPERNQLFELKRQYTFESVANQFEYQLPFYTYVNQTDHANTVKTSIPLYQMILDPVYVDGVQIGLYTSNDSFYKIYPELVNNEQVLVGTGSTFDYTINYGRFPILRGFTDDLGNLEPYVFITSIDVDGNNILIVDDGNGNLIQTDPTFQYNPYNIGESPPNVGTVDYINGIATFTSIEPVLTQAPIFSQTSPYSAGVPRIMLFFNNIIKLYPVPDRAYKIQADAYITPSQFLTTAGSVPFAYMAEYIARGAARKILSDNGDYEQFQFYEPLFKEQECLVLRRTDRQRSVNRTPTIFSSQQQQQPWLYTQY